MAKKTSTKKAFIRKPFSERVVSPGKLYKEITVSREEFEAGERKLLKKKVPKFVKFCRSINNRFPSLGKGAKFKREYREAIDFLGWDLTAEEFASAAKFVMFAVLFVGGILGIIVYTFFGEFLEKIFQSAPLVPVYIFAPVILLTMLATNYIQSYPIGASRAEQTRALTYVPEIIGYMIMSMKLVPNLEKAVEFAAEHGHGKIADDFKRMIWDVQVGVFNSLSEALDDLAYRWGKFSDEFKHALMMVRASVLETTEAKRYQLLDKTMVSILDSIKNKMENYARSLSQPSILLFYMGILLPLILIIILPVGSAFSGQPFAQPLVLIAVYNIAIPAATLFFAMSVIKQRPPTYEPPVIPDDFPALPRKWSMRVGNVFVDTRFIVLMVLVIGVFSSFYLSAEGMPPKSLLKEGSMQILPADKSLEEVMALHGYEINYFEVDGPYEEYLQSIGMSENKARERVALEKQQFFMQPENDITKYNLVFGLLITASVCVFILLYFSNIYKRKAQLQVVEMESEFKDSIYVLASRMGENKPVEEALKHTKKFLPNLLISDRIFGRTIDNIELLGMPLESAVFDPNYGSLKNIPSNIIKSSMKILVDSVQLGVNVAARTLMSLSMQLRNSEKVNKMLSTLVSDVTSMMKNMTIFIAPVVLGITTSLQKVVMLTLASIVTSDITQQISKIENIGGGFNVSGLQAFGLKTKAFQSMVTPLEFLIIVAVYVIELVIIMMYFTTKIEEDNNVLLKLNIAKALPIAVIVFLVSVVLSNLIVGGFL